jgi:hypothetical protein
MTQAVSAVSELEREVVAGYKGDLT